MEGELLAIARPYLQVFSLLTLMPPPRSYEISCRSCEWKILIWIFGWYSFGVLLVGFYITYVNIAVLHLEVMELGIGDFTMMLGLVQKFFYVMLLVSVYVNMVISARRLGRIYMEIAALEQDIDAAAWRFGSKRRKRSTFRRRLGLRCGLWSIILFIAFPRLTLPTLTDYMSWYDKILTEWLLLVLQFKSVEYTLFVVLAQELLLRLRHTLIHLKQELTSCEQSDLLHALCTAMRCNKQLLARIWLLVGQLEIYFMLPMLLLYLYNGLCTLHVVNWAYIQALNPQDCCRYWRFGNLLLLQINLLIPCWLSQNCINTYKSFNRILHNIRSGFGKATPELLRSVLMEYALQMQHLKLRFTCGGFFNIDLKFFGGTTVTIISYAIILIQFKLQALLEAKRQKLA